MGVDNLLGKSEALGGTKNPTNLGEVLDEFRIGGSSCRDLGVNGEVGIGARRSCETSAEELAMWCYGGPL